MKNHVISIGFAIALVFFAPPADAQEPGEDHPLQTFLYSALFGFLVFASFGCGTNSDPDNDKDLLLAEACSGISMEAGIPVDSDDLQECVMGMAQLYDTVDFDHTINGNQVSGKMSIADPFTIRGMTENQGMTAEFLQIENNAWMYFQGSWHGGQSLGYNFVLGGGYEWVSWHLASDDLVEINGYTTYEWQGTLILEDIATLTNRYWLTSDFLLIHGLATVTYTSGDSHQEEYNYSNWGEADPPEVPDEIDS